jgi:hypothetical protein
METLAPGLVTWSVHRIQVDGIRTRAGGTWPGPMFSIFPDTAPWAAARWQPDPATEEELDRYVRTGDLPDQDAEVWP